MQVGKRRARRWGPISGRTDSTRKEDRLPQHSDEKAGLRDAALRTQRRQETRGCLEPSKDEIKNVESQRMKKNNKGGNHTKMKMVRAVQLFFLSSRRQQMRISE